ncbi:MAG: 2OG-Fe(II) oxygenase [Cyanobacteria bacterium J06627_28]
MVTLASTESSFFTRRRSLFLKFANELNYRCQLIKSVGHLPLLSQVDRNICRELDRTGIVITSLETLGLPSTSLLTEAIRRFLPQLKQSTIAGNLSENRRAAASHCLYGDPVVVGRDFPAIYLWGLEERLLNILENYYGAPVVCIGANVRRDLADGQQQGTKLWHLDGEDRKVVKVAVYLNDIDDKGGPFEYIPDRLSPSYKDFPSSVISDEDMETVVPASQWKACEGPKGTVIIADNARLFHHGKLPMRDRYVVFYAYAYRHPKRPEFCQNSPWRKGLPFIREKLSQRQKDAIWNYKGL